MSDTIQTALTAIELRESELLAWGAVGAEWRHDELRELLAEYGDAGAILDEMCDKALLVETPTGGYRSRSAETVRLLATLRQSFRQEAILHGRPLVLDYRFLQRPRRRPRRDIPADEFISDMSGIGRFGVSSLRKLLPPKASAFQLRSTRSILAALGASEPSGVMVTAGTGSGKTLAFYLPMISWICDQSRSGADGVLALALYPRNELLKDQLRTLVAYALTLSVDGNSVPPLSLATWFGATPKSAHAVRQGWERDWLEMKEGHICPFLRCPLPACDSELIWPRKELGEGVELLRCTECSLEIPGQVLRLTRDSARRKPAHVMLSTTESLNRQLSSPANLYAFGIGNRSLKAVLLDEVHTYEGTTGAQNAYLFRRLRKSLGYNPLWAGLSATLANAGEFFGRLVDLDSGCVSVVEPDPDELEESGAEYLVALRHNPHGNTGSLSTTIQAAMALSRCLDPMNGNPFNPPVDSQGIFGSRLFAFTDKLDSTNRLYWDLLDAEGWAWPGKQRQRQRPQTLAHLRSGEQARVVSSRREAREARDMDGQYWWLPEQLGHEVDGDVQKRVGRTSSQDSGVTANADIIVATASLEVGFDDDRVGAVIQHKAPHDVAQFLQRKGRAGRNAATRPWTVVVLSDWGRDREAWDAYDSLFSPVVPPRVLPLENLYVLRIQSVYSLLDWLALELNYGTDSTWADTSGPADLLSGNSASEVNLRERQDRISVLLTSLLRDGVERAALRRHLRQSLGLGSGPSTDRTIEKIFWEAPRPLLASVVPTLRRRLTDQWMGERPGAEDAMVRTRTPLRDFVPGNLFDELLVPDVEFRVPWQRGETHVEHLPALRSIREFMPGNVSRHFGVWASNKRHWVPLPMVWDAGGARMIDVASYGGTPVGEFFCGETTIRVFAPSSIQLDSVPPEVSDASSMRPDWSFAATVLGRGVRIPSMGLVSGLFESLISHMHSQGGGVRILRYTRSGRGTLWTNGQSTPERVLFGTLNNDVWDTAALGVESHCDAIQGKVIIPSFDPSPSASERVDWMRELVLRNSEFPADLSDFDRLSLSDALEVVAASWDWTDGTPAEGAFVAALGYAATTLGLVDSGNPTVLTAWLRDERVTGELRRSLLAAREGMRSTEWLMWLESRFVRTVANVFLAAITGAGGSVDTDELTVDLDPDDRSVFFISEQSPGGTGQVESLTRALVEYPDRLVMSLADVMRPSDVESVDIQLRAVIGSRTPAVVQSIELLASSWREGHIAVRKAADALDSALADADIGLEHAARTALSTRLAGPGASSDLIAEIGTWLSIRDAAELTSGFAVEPRTLAALVAGRTAVDGVLRLEDPSESRRARAVANVLWPWGRAARPNGSFNPYVDNSEVALDLLRRNWKSATVVLEFETWDASIRAELDRMLRESREMILRVPTSRRKVLRSAIIGLQTVPIEVGPMWCYAEVLGVSERNAHSEARILLREVW